MDRSAAAQAAAEIAKHLREDVLDLWFPRCVSAAGGFHQVYDRQWRAVANGRRSIVFQARMTWVCAVIAKREESATFAGYARHGLRFVETMIDLRNGMPRWETDLRGHSVGRHSAEFHAYGLAFAIFALSGVARLSESGSSLRRARDIFAWLDTYHRDRDHGGYHDVTRWNGSKVLRSGLRGSADAIGGPYGCKSSNTHIHLLEAFVALFAVWPDLHLARRIEELVEILTSHFWVEPGQIALTRRSDWNAAPGTASSGHAVELAHLILAAASAVGRNDDPLRVAKAKALVDTAIAGHWMSLDGLADTGSAERLWWVQAEGMAGLAGLFRTTGDARYLDLLIRHWNWVRAHQLDPDHGGWFGSVLPDGSCVGDGLKAWAWKDCYHEVRALLAAADVLAGLAEPDIAISIGI